MKAGVTLVEPILLVGCQRLTFAREIKKVMFTAPADRLAVRWMLAYIQI